MHTALLALVLSFCCTAQAQLQDILQQATEGMQRNRSGSLSDQKIASGLSEALRVSTGKAVAATGRPDGFLKNEAIKILLPEKLRPVAKGLRMLGRGAQVDELEIGMNRAAEQATPLAKQIFLNAIKRMTFSDARQIFTGGNTAATDYFKRQSTDELTEAFAPIVKEQMERVGVIQQYNRMLKSTPGGTALTGNFDINKYVVGKTLDGLFYMLGEEEKKIRTNPAARTTAILREVFGRK
ncbi:MAG TPA: DUF4197 domain-containing protein [Terriglobales bacterium]|nr:DUF4197 domain-containing protein [Terriglobales bacterium]